MNLDELVTQDNADSGEWFRVEIYDNLQNFELKIYGSDSDEVMKYTRQKIQASAQTTKKKKLDDADIDEVLEMGNENVMVRIDGIRGLKVDDKGNVLSHDEPVLICGKELKNNRESYELLITKIPAIKEYVLKFSGDRTNFLSIPKKN
jgi:hypothetical protein